MSRGNDEDVNFRFQKQKQIGTRGSLRKFESEPSFDQKHATSFLKDLGSQRMQVIKVANRIRRKGSYHGKIFHPLAVRSSGHIACHPLVFRCPSIRTIQGDAGEEG